VSTVATRRIAALSSGKREYLDRLLAHREPWLRPGANVVGRPLPSVEAHALAGRVAPQSHGVLGERTGAASGLPAAIVATPLGRGPRSDRICSRRGGASIAPTIAPSLARTARLPRVEEPARD
jgi:hypothetical protein